MKRLLFAILLASSAQGAITTVADTLYLANGTRFSGPINISWPTTFTSASGRVIPAGKLSTIVVNGALSVGLEANDLATPTGTYYIAQYKLNNGIATTEFWVVPTSVSPVTLATVRTVPAPSTSFMIALSQLLQTGATVGQCIVWGGTTYGPSACGPGTLTTISFTGGLISVANPTTTPALTVAGTSGGIPYFSSTSTWASSGVLGANLPLFGGGAGATPIAGTRTGNTTQLATWTGATTASRCVHTDASGNLTIASTDCGTGAGTTIWQTAGSTTATEGTANFVAGTGITLTGSNPAGKYQLVPAVDTAVILSLANDQSGAPRYCVSATGNDTYTCTLTPTLGAYTAGGCLVLKPGTANTGAASLNVDTLGALAILTRALATPATGDIPANTPTELCLDPTASNWVIMGGATAGAPAFSAITAGTNANALVTSGSITYTGGGFIQSNLLYSFGLCASAGAPATCGASTGGAVIIPDGSTTVTVNDSFVTSDNQILVQFESSVSLGTRLGVTCNTTFVNLSISARTTSTSFVVTASADPAGANPVCLSFTIIN